MIVYCRLARRSATAASVTAALMVPAGAGPASVSITVTGTVEATCAQTAVTRTVRAPDLFKAGRDAIGFDVDCNAPFEYRLESKNGGFTTEAPVPAGSGFQSAVPYTVQIRIPLDGGGSIADTCESTQIKAGTETCIFASSGNAVAIKKTAAMTLTWGSPPRPLTAGSYRDELKFSLALRP